jgi:hypothetical protein
MVFPDGLKVIYDTRSREAELYDLKLDPNERSNVFDREPRAAAALQKLKRFFLAHRLPKEGYRPPYIR